MFIPPTHPCHTPLVTLTPLTPLPTFMNTISKLFLTDDNINYMADGNAVELVLKSLKTHVKVSNLSCDVSMCGYLCFVFGKEAGVAKYACAALSSMAEAEGNRQLKLCKSLCQ